MANSLRMCLLTRNILAVIQPRHQNLFMESGIELVRWLSLLTLSDFVSRLTPSAPGCQDQAGGPVLSTPLTIFVVPKVSRHQFEIRCSFVERCLTLEIYGRSSVRPCKAKRWASEFASVLQNMVTKCLSS